MKRKLLEAAALVLAFVLGAVGAQSAERKNSVLAAAAAHQEGRLSACSQLIKGLGPQLVPFELHCAVYKGKVAITSSEVPGFPSIDITDGKPIQ